MRSSVPCRAGYIAGNLGCATTLASLRAAGEGEDTPDARSAVWRRRLMGELPGRCLPVSQGRDCVPTITGISRAGARLAQGSYQSASVGKEEVLESLRQGLIGLAASEDLLREINARMMKLDEPIAAVESPSRDVT